MPGGPLALDLLNTTWATASGPFDWLADDDAVEQFVSEHGRSIPTEGVVAVRASLVQARDLVMRLFEDPSSALADDVTVAVNQALESAKAIVVESAQGPTVSVTGDQPHNGVAIEALVNAVELRRDRPDRVRSCEHEACVLWFLDTSKGGRRRWCSMDRCGNRAKAQRHYKRSTQPND